MDICTYEEHGRKLLVEFKCRRCGTTALRPLQESVKEADYIQGLWSLNPPKEWYNGGFYYPLFCPDCKRAYDEFMDGKDADNG